MSDQKPKVPANMPARPGGFGPGRGGPMMGMPAEKPKDFAGTMRTLLKYLGQFRTSLVVVMVFAVIGTVFGIVSPKILGTVTNKVVTGYVDGKIYDQLTAGRQLPAGTTGAQVLDRLPASQLDKIPAAERDTIRGMNLAKRPTIDFDGIWRSAKLLLLLYLISALFTYVQGWVMATISQKVAFNLRRDISLKMGRLPLSYFDKRTHGEVLSRVTNDVETISQTLNQGLAQVVTSLVTIVGILVMMLSISWQLTVVALLMLPLSFGLLGLVMGRSQKFFVAQQATLGKINGHVEEMFSGHTVMKAFGGEQQSVAAFKRINHQLYDSAWKAQFFSGLLMPIMMFVGNLGYVAVAVLGGWLAVRGAVNIGDIQAFIQYMGQFTQPITQMASTATIMQSTAAAAERVFEFLGEPEQVPEASEPARPENVRGEVSFEDVTFGYSADKTVIHGFTAHIQPGQKVAIVGPTGAGKTTLVNLLMRFYDVSEGSIKVDGVDIRDFKRDDLRRMFGMVLQDAWLFTGTIKDNIAYGKPGASMAEIEAAAKAAHADHFIRALPGGYEMELNEEADNVSQGEKQLLTIARAWLSDAPMLILDEATSSVDTRTEALIQAAMEKLMQGRTSFVIAHRLSTIKGADLILVLRDGNIVEQGRHEELLKRNGFYASLYNSQFSEGE